MEDEIIEALAKTTLFRGLGKRHLRLIARVTDVVELPEGHDLFREGEPTTHLSVIVEGRASVLVDGSQVAELGEGDVVGELSMIDEGVSSATVRTATPTTIYNIARSGFVPVWRKNHEISDAMLLAVVERLRETNARLSELARRQMY